MKSFWFIRYECQQIYSVLPKCSPNRWTNSCSECQRLSISTAPHRCQLGHLYQSGGCEMGVNGISLFTFYYQLGWEPFPCVFCPFWFLFCSYPLLSFLLKFFSFLISLSINFWIIVICWLHGLQKSVPSSWLIFNFDYTVFVEQVLHFKITSM